ncbi:L,D-transpeptidase family protein [Vibrio coralliilyticus]|uniref:L,D-transpeptidase family protein n=1 Tax=Vibrio coralliilyticus TaxID=190893 RepID=UPI0017D361B8|nr:L,D-transpeptidase family protein [Vibrio coralliilyticus]NUW70106.1 L,D-transpeptidase family protein [Vibrio coralliilyticus]
MNGTVLRTIVTLGALLFTCASSAMVDLVKVDKSKRRMYLIDNGQVVKEFRIALGKHPKGHKTQEGDHRTPEGLYYLDFVIDKSEFYRSIHISYPNPRDIAYAAKLRVDPGGDIKIHGLRNGEKRPAKFVQSFDWTNGCIAITNEEMDELLTLVKTGTPIEIRW